MELLEYHCFTGMSKEDEQKLLKEAKPVMIPSNSVLYYSGDICQDLLFLKSGSVKIFVQPKEIGSEEMTLYELNKGSQCVVNLLSTITSQPALATAQTITPIEGWLLPKDTILWLINNSESFREFKIDMMGSRVSALVNLLVNVKFTSIEQQLLNWLHVQGLEKIKITHEKIASFIGVTRETVSRNLKRLEKKGYIELSRGSITLH